MRGRRDLWLWLGAVSLASLGVALTMFMVLARHLVPASEAAPAPMSVPMETDDPETLDGPMAADEQLPGGAGAPMPMPTGLEPAPRDTVAAPPPPLPPVPAAPPPESGYAEMRERREPPELRSASRPGAAPTNAGPISSRGGVRFDRRAEMPGGPADGGGRGGGGGGGGAGSARSAPVLVDRELRFVRLFYGTNRLREEVCGGVATSRWNDPGRCRPTRFYGGEPAPAGENGGLELGTAMVTFPPNHEPGVVDRPFEVFSISQRNEDPDRDVVIDELRSFPGDEAGWVRRLQATGRDQAFIYVHGFETTFDEAVRRTAQLAFDLDFDREDDFRGVPMLFSWPSGGRLEDYVADLDTSVEAIAAFNRYLDLIKAQAGIKRVHVIAHSMGNRLVAEALYARGERASPILDQLVLAAPDIWAKAFKDRLLHRLPQLAARVTLYVSDQDRALIAARRIRRDRPRAGDVAGGLLAASQGVDRFDAINASSLPRDFLGHSYYASSGSMLSDIYCLLKGEPASKRPLLIAADVAWQFRPLAQLLLWRGNIGCAAHMAPWVVREEGLPWRRILATLAAGLLALAGVARWRRRRRAAHRPGSARRR